MGSLPASNSESGGNNDLATTVSNGSRRGSIINSATSARCNDSANNSNGRSSATKRRDSCSSSFQGASSEPKQLSHISQDTSAKSSKQLKHHHNNHNQYGKSISGSKEIATNKRDQPPKTYNHEKSFMNEQSKSYNDSIHEAYDDNDSYNNDQLLTGYSKKDVRSKIYADQQSLGTIFAPTSSSQHPTESIKVSKESSSSSNHHYHDTGDGFRKQSHCEIEKRRRDKMNHYIMQLATMIPSFNNNSAKFDKLTVLRMAVQHVKSLRSSLCSFSSFHMRPPFLSSGNLLKNLILQMASQESQDNLFMVVTCDRGKVLFVSQSSKDILHQEKDELIGQCLFDMLHKDDVSKVKEQISYFNLQPREMLVDSKTLQPIKNIHQRQTYNHWQNKFTSTPLPGARRSFFCRMRIGLLGPGEASKSDLSLAPSSLITDSPSSSLPSTFPSSTSPSSSSGSSSNTSLRKNNKSRQEREGTGKFSSKSAYLQSKPDKGSEIVNSDLAVSLLPPLMTVNNDLRRQTFEPRINNDSSTISNPNKQPNHDVSATKEDHGPRKAKNISKNSNRTSYNNVKNSTANHTSFEHYRESRKSNSHQLRKVKEISDTTVNKTDDGKQQGSRQSSNNKSEIYKKRLRYLLMHFTGYMRTISLRNDELDDDEEEYDDCMSDKNSIEEEYFDTFRDVMCLVAICRRSPVDLDIKPDRPLTFTCRYSMEGKFVFVDQKTTIALGYTPQQLLGTSHYAYCHKDSVNTFKECHRESILKSEPVSSDIYQFKRANGQSLWLQTSLRCFRNPWTKFIDYIVANHTTAESNDPIYNDGCVSNKYSRDVAGEGSQSSSPASSSSLSTDSKKSTSPSSSSMASSYSLDSCASNGSIQALLNHIDRVKSGGVRHALNFHKKTGDVRLTKAGPVSINKSNDDSGVYSDPQSCSSLSSNNSGTGSTEFPIIINNFIDCGVNSSSNLSVPVNVIGQKPIPVYRMTTSSCAPTIYPALPPPPTQTVGNTNMSGQLVEYRPSLTSESACKISTRSYVPMNESMKPPLKPYSSHYDYGYIPKTISTNSETLTAGSNTSWQGPSVPVYSCPSEEQTLNSEPQVQVVIPAVATVQSEPVGKLDQSQSYLIHPMNPPIGVVQEHVPITNQMNSIDTRGYDNMLPVDQFMTSEFDPIYTNNSAMNQIQHDTSQTRVTINVPNQQVGSQSIDESMAMSIIYNGPSADGSYPNTVDNNQQNQICDPVSGSTSQMIAQPHIQPCQQCANHRCHNMQTLSTNSTDLNSINLTSLAVDGDLDEDQLLEYLAGCDPESQFNSMQSGTYTQYNVYR